MEKQKSINTNNTDDNMLKQILDEIKVLSTSKNINSAEKEQYNYCPTRGQKLDYVWGNTQNNANDYEDVIECKRCGNYDYKGGSKLTISKNDSEGEDIHIDLCPYCTEWLYEWLRNDNYEMVVNREFPMKLEYESDGCSKGEEVYDIAICPECGRRFETEYEEHYEYCPSCGQRIDWEGK